MTIPLGMSARTAVSRDSTYSRSAAGGRARHTPWRSDDDENWQKPVALPAAVPFDRVPGRTAPVSR